MKSSSVRTKEITVRNQMERENNNKKKNQPETPNLNQYFRR